ncbi:MAG: hypothetical protein ACRDC6_32130, partial [Shewanella sp.]
DGDWLPLCGASLGKSHVKRAGFTNETCPHDLVPIRGIELLTFALRIQIFPISTCFTSSHSKA